MKHSLSVLHSAPKYLLLNLTMALVGSVGNARIASVDSVCGSLYDRVSSITSFLLGEHRDERLAPSVDRFLRSYVSRHADTPSYETYVERLDQKKLDASIDRCDAYKMLQWMSRSVSETDLKPVVDIFTRLESLVGPVADAKAVMDEHGLAYLECVRAHIVRTIENLPEDSHFHFTREEVLEQLKRP